MEYLQVSRETEPSDISKFLEENLRKLISPVMKYDKVMFCPVFWPDSDIPVEDDIRKLSVSFRKRLGAELKECPLGSKEVEHKATKSKKKELNPKGAVHNFIGTF